LLCLVFCFVFFDLFRNSHCSGVHENLKNRFSFSIYNPFALSPVAATVYLHHENQFNVTVRDGSGHVDLALDSTVSVAPVATKTLPSMLVFLFLPRLTPR
jgi:hypothetical protein